MNAAIKPAIHSAPMAFKRLGIFIVVALVLIGISAYWVTDGFTKPWTHFRTWTENAVIDPAAK